MPKRHEYFPILRKELIIDKLEEEKRKNLKNKFSFLWLVSIVKMSIHLQKRKFQLWILDMMRKQTAGSFRTDILRSISFALNVLSL